MRRGARGDGLGGQVPGRAPDLRRGRPRGWSSPAASSWTCQCPARPVIIGTVGIGGPLGWSWLLPPYQWAFGAVCATEVRAIEFLAPAVRDRCAADPDLGHELTQRMFKVLAGRLRDTRARLIARSVEAGS
jgi:hypothetical protein